MIKIDNPARCCGCGACANICPVGCIAMRPDAEGFDYPSVDADRCVGCGRCEQVCPVLRADSGAMNADAAWDNPKAVGGWNRDDAVRQESSSGGVFTLLAGEILRRGGVVFGAVMKDLVVRHTCAESEAELAAMRGSKYVQSALGDTYRQVRSHLKAGKPVLFTGTPCQTAGLVSFLGERADNLFLVDFVCHGVPSPKIFREYLQSIGQKSKAEVTAFSFRGKEKGWYSKGSRLQMGPQARLSDGSEIHVYPALKDTYINGFLEDYTLRPSCYECAFKGIPRRAADITLADFWGVDSALPAMNDGKGTSLVLIHNDKGMELFNAIREDIQYQECDWKTATAKNPSLLTSSRRPPIRDRIFDDLENEGYDGVARRYLSARKVVLKKVSGKADSILERAIDGVAGIALRLLPVGKSGEAKEKIKQFIKFCMVGATNVLVAYSTNILTLFLLNLVAPGFKWDYVVANIVAFLVSVYWSFYWNSRKVFNFNVTDREARRKALLKSYLCYGFTGIVLNNILSTIWIHGLGISKLVSPLLNLVFTIPVNYITNKKWAFAQKTGKDRET